MINYSYLYARPGYQAENTCRISHGPQFVISFLSGVIWLRTLWDYPVLAEKVSALLYFTFIQEKKSHRDQSSRYIKTFCKQRTKKKYTWMRKKSVATLFLNFSLQVLHTSEPWSARLQYCQCYHVMYMDPNVGEMLFLVPHIFNPQD